MKRKIAIALVLTLILSLGLVTAAPVAAADPTTIASSTMVFEGVLTDNGDGTYAGTIPMAEGAGFDVYAREGATAWFADPGDPDPVWSSVTISDHDAWSKWNPDTPDWDCYALTLDGSDWRLVYNENESRDWAETWASPMSGTMDWDAMYAAETNSGSGQPPYGDDERIWWSGTGWAATKGGGAACWDMDWGSPNWSEVVPLAFPGFAVEVTGEGPYVVTLAPAAGVNPPGPVVNTDTGESYGAVQVAIDSASPDDTISVAVGIYEEDLDIDATKSNLELVGSEATIKGIQNVPMASWPLAVPNINILADGVSIHGFTIEGPDYTADYYASGIVLDGLGIEIYDNDFVTTAAETTDELAHAITTYSLTAIEGADPSGLNIHDNTFVGSGAIGSEFIYVNPHTGTGAIIIDTNQFSGSVLIGATVESGEASFTNNTVSNDAEGSGWYGVRFMDSQYGANGIYGNIVVSGNNIAGFVRAVRVGNGANPDTADFVGTISANTLSNNELGVWGRNGSQLTVVNNNIVDNTVGILNANGDTDATAIDAINNWWGTTDGEAIAAMVSGDVTYEPWLTESYPPAPRGGGGISKPPPGTTKVAGDVDRKGVFEVDVTATTRDKQCALTIPEGTVGLTDGGYPLRRITMDKMDEPPPPPEGANVIGLPYDFGPDGATFSPPITLTWSYDPDTVPEGMDLVVAYWDGSGWRELENCGINTVTNTITADVSHFTAFAVLAHTPVVVVVPPVEVPEVVAPPVVVAPEEPAPPVVVAPAPKEPITPPAEPVGRDLRWLIGVVVFCAIFFPIRWWRSRGQ